MQNNQKAKSHQLISEQELIQFYKKDSYGSSTILQDPSQGSQKQINVEMESINILMKNNVAWAEQNLRMDPEFFNKMKGTQHPEYLWIGCADSRVPPDQIVGLKPGQLFVHRNIGNQAHLSDINTMAVIQYAVQILKVKDIIVCGHTNCGGIKACFNRRDYGSLQEWLSFIRDLRVRHRKQLTHHSQQQDQQLLVELNVIEQVSNIARVPIIQKAWMNGQTLRIHGLVYHLESGILKDLGKSIDSMEHLPEEFRIY